MTGPRITLDPARAFLGALMHLDVEAAAVASIMVEPADLTDPFLRDILAAVKTLLGEGKPPDPVLLRQWLIPRGYADVHRNKLMGEALVRLFTEAPAVVVVEHYAELVVEGAYREALRVMAGRMTQAADTSTMPALAAVLASEVRRVNCVRQRLPEHVLQAAS